MEFQAVAGYLSGDSDAIAGPAMEPLPYVVRQKPRVTKGGPSTDLTTLSIWVTVFATCRCARSAISAMASDGSITA